MIPGTDTKVFPTHLDGVQPKLKFRDRPRTILADWMISDRNTYFSRTAVNRLWGHFFGVGVVNPVVIVHLVGDSHNDSLMVGLMMAGLALALERRREGPAILSGAVFAGLCTASIISAAAVRGHSIDVVLVLICHVCELAPGLLLTGPHERQAVLADEESDTTGTPKFYAHS